MEKKRKIQKTNYLKNEKSFLDEIKGFFIVFEGLSFGERNKKITDTSFKHSHKKWKDSLETWAVLLIFYLELEISGLAVQRIHQSSEKWWLVWGIAQ